MHKFVNNVEIEMLEKLNEIEKVLDDSNHSFHSYAITGRKRREIEDEINNEVSKAVHEIYIKLNENYDFDVDRDSYAKLFQRVKSNRKSYFIVAEFYRIKEVSDTNEKVFCSTYERIEKVAELEISVDLV